MDSSWHILKRRSSLGKQLAQSLFLTSLKSLNGLQISCQNIFLGYLFCKLYYIFFYSIPILFSFLFSGRAFNLKLPIFVYYVNVNVNVKEN
jgi:hypothetical protein